MDNSIQVFLNLFEIVKISFSKWLVIMVAIWLTRNVRIMSMRLHQKLQHRLPNNSPMSMCQIHQGLKSLIFESTQKFYSEHRFQFSKKSDEFQHATVKPRYKIWKHWLTNKQLRFRYLKIESIGLLMTTTKILIERNVLLIKNAS